MRTKPANLGQLQRNKHLLKQYSKNLTQISHSVKIDFHMPERQPFLSEGSSRNAAIKLFEGWGKAFKEDGRVRGYIVRHYPHAQVRFVTEVVMLDVEMFLDSRVSMTRTYPGAEEESIKTKIILDRAHIKPRALAKLLRRNLPLPKRNSLKQF
jgi:hypothetical protein